MTSSAHIATRSWPMVSKRWRAAAIAVFVPTPSVELTMSGSRSPAGRPTTLPNPPMPLRTSGRCVASTAARMRSTARSPAATLTPLRVYAVLMSATSGRGRSCERRLGQFLQDQLAIDVVWDGLGIVAVETGEAEPLVRQIESRKNPANREVRKRVGADELTDLGQRMGSGDEL